MKENVFYVATALTEESVVSFYDNVARTLGFDPDMYTYDCTKIEVSPERETNIRDYYTKKGLSAGDISMTWLMIGPKVNNSLFGEVVKVEFTFFNLVENQL